MENLITTVTKTSFICTDDNRSRDTFVVEERSDTNIITVWDGNVGKTYDCSFEDIVGGFKMFYKTVIRTSTTVSTTVKQNIIYKK